jgi:DNA-binding transcriptional ArsR family regulator
MFALMKRDVFQAIADPTRRAILVLIEIKCDKLSDLEKILKWALKKELLLHWKILTNWLTQNENLTITVAFDMDFSIREYLQAFSLEITKEAVSERILPLEQQVLL